jgi:hypothetical protein
MDENKNHREIVSLREYLESRLEAIQATMTATDKSMEIRLNAMNELRDQINQERGRYITKDEHEPTHQRLESDVRDLRESRAELAGKASMTSVYWTGLMAALAMLISLVSSAMQLFRQ